MPVSLDRPLPGLSRIVWFTVGTMALLLGLIGVVLPVMPTTPFIILAAFAFGKSSRRLQMLLEESRMFGPIIADWRANGAIAPRYKAIALSMMAAALALSLAMSLPAAVIAVQALCMLAAAAFILTRPNGPR